MISRAAKLVVVGGAAAALVAVAGAAGAATGSRPPSADCERLHEVAADHARAYERLGAERDALVRTGARATSTEVADLDRRGRQQYLLSMAVVTAAPECSSEADVQVAQAAVLHLFKLEGQDQSADHFP